MRNKKKIQNKHRFQKKAETSSINAEEPIEIPIKPEFEKVEEVCKSTTEFTKVDEVCKSTTEFTKVDEVCKSTTEFAKVDETDENQNCTIEPIMESPAIDAPPEVPEVIKHPLENTWGFWLFTNEKKNWTENQKELTSFNTVEDYWCLYHHMKLPSELRVGQDYSIFKQGISPMWEDKANKVGGRWFINLDRKGSETDRIWLDVVLLMIGENFQNSDLICGAVVNIRPKNRVSVWTRNKQEAANMEIGKKLKETLRINFKLQFLDHKNNSVLFCL